MDTPNAPGSAGGFAWWITVGMVTIGVLLVMVSIGLGGYNVTHDRDMKVELIALVLAAAGLACLLVSARLLAGHRN